ncbi:YqgQ family protein [Mangrovibacillus cuniculi]|uniref:YqgQ family protein n=1 Tax=Mangrovibacillus cuniculi TaxID=2593652 RepID=A0A7S8CBG4_9BACI|nr:YqgQ family protein [Mangrovibacillus cuniculi]QPC46872.1 YqgQ family protein [Mangrovibacillus cuniculi]
MKTFYDVQQLLKRFGTIIYTKDRLADLELMEMEIRDLYDAGVLERQDFQMALLLLRQEQSKLKR